MLSDEEMKVALDALCDGDGVTRHGARERLEKVVMPAEPYLLGALQSPNEHSPGSSQGPG